MAWTGLARVVRSKFMSLREEDFVTAARGYNTPSSVIILRHLIPNFLSYIIVNLTLAIPDMILAETSLSFLGIGLRPPVVSLGVLLEKAQSFQTVALYPWLLIPGLVVIVVVLAYNFVGDGLRDAADPYK
jgi:peptide/nickel transport system permease protein